MDVILYADDEGALRTWIIANFASWPDHIHYDGVDDLVSWLIPRTPTYQGVGTESIFLGKMTDFDINDGAGFITATGGILEALATGVNRDPGNSPFDNLLLIPAAVIKYDLAYPTSPDPRTNFCEFDD